MSMAPPGCCDFFGLAIKAYLIWSLGESAWGGAFRVSASGRGLRRQMLTRPRGIGAPPYALSAELAPEAVFGAEAEG